MPTPITGKVSDETQIRIHEQYLQEAFAQGEYFENFEKTHYCHVFKTHSQGMSKDMVKLLNIVLEKDYYVVEEQPFDEKQFLSILETDLKYCTSIKKLMFVILNTMKLSTNKNNYQLLDAVHLFNIIKLIKHETYIQEMKEHYKKYTGLFVQLEHIYKDMEKLPQLKEFLDKKDISQRSIKELSPTYSAKPVKVDKKN
ncbi:hypothetical protein AB837_00001 [bacterium AB1]|nr:hypothetical protein AB837_00001 [bacterium AB1]